jgi:hypothetical protein
VLNQSLEGIALGNGESKAAGSVTIPKLEHTDKLTKGFPEASGVADQGWAMNNAFL